MINSNKTSAWQTALINAITDPKQLLDLLELDPTLLTQAVAAAKLFPLKVTRSFIARMEKGNINDPLLRQILPLGAETELVPGYEKDPLQEKNANPVPGLLHKYHGRVLLTITGACGIHCRFCFRRHFPYAENNPGTSGWEQALNYIMANNTITEVILSGGDPLTANDNMLHGLTQKLATIPHLQRLRIHSRMPIVLPERITDEFIRAVSHPKLKTIMVVHCNHPQEINADVAQAMVKLAQAGMVLLNQSVLLRGINDHVETLTALSEALFAIGIQPYYLHTHDKVQGAAHFDHDHSFAQKLHWELTQRLSGYLVPKLVCEMPGVGAKVGL